MIWKDSLLRARDYNSVLTRLSLETARNLLGILMPTISVTIYFVQGTITLMRTLLRNNNSIKNGASCKLRLGVRKNNRLMLTFHWLMKSLHIEPCSDKEVPF